MIRSCTSRSLPSSSLLKRTVTQRERIRICAAYFPARRYWSTGMSPPLYSRKYQSKAISRFLTASAQLNSATQEKVDTKIIHDPSVEHRYSRKTPLEHILLRPGMYVGPNNKLPAASHWALEKTPPVILEGSLISKTRKSHSFQMAKRDLSLVPALCKVFDEILVNASDNRLRHPERCTQIDVVIDPGAKDRDPYISVRNNGDGIPVVLHKKEGMYVPEMLFGHLLTGSNFDDDERRLTGGRHGYGAKLANIFSKRFTVETLDAARELKYRQTWASNMTTRGDPEILKTSGNVEDFTIVEFVPDLPRLLGDKNAYMISSDDYLFMCRRVVDVAGCGDGLRVTLNGHDVSARSFSEYCELYRSNNSSPMCCTRMNSRWTLGVALSETGSFEAVSFVNGMATPRGGTHVDVLSQQISKRILRKAEKLEPALGALLSQSLIKRHIFICVDAKIENPVFDSQMKEYLTSRPSAFGSSFKLKEKFLAEVVKGEEDGGPGIVEELLRAEKGRQQQKLLKKVGGKKTRRQLLSIPKLDDAHKAGSKSGSDCTLILTEGDSAKALAVAGLEVVGRDRFGVFPLRGKFLNVRDASSTKISESAEVKALISILGLKFAEKYDTLEKRRQLRYGRVMIMTDQDTDGSHIKGLIINFFRHFWPELLQAPSNLSTKANVSSTPFLASFVTPLLKVKKKGNKQETLAFYSVAEYNAWRRDEQPDMKIWTAKYYKGLGTSTAAEARDYFSAFQKNLRPFRWKSRVDGERIDMVFDKSRAPDRRDWITNEFDIDSTATVDPGDENSVSYADFIDSELIHYSHADNIRSIPSMVDGLKPSQRKVLHACFVRHLTSELKVAQLTGYCCEKTAYHHGDASMISTIIGMAQNFVGSNNINLLEPCGSFGTRLAGGSDAASARYIFTHLAPITRYIFPEADDSLLDYRQDDGQVIEPAYFCPIVPMLLINGSQGIGTGWSTVVPPHNPLDVLNYIRAKLDGHSELPAIRPYVRGFTGVLQTKDGSQDYESIGTITKLNESSLAITELPVGVWTDKYKTKLLKMQSRGQIDDFQENHTTTEVSFIVTMKSLQLAKFEKTGLESVFKLRCNHLTNNMHAFDSDYKITKYDSPESIAESFFPVRMQLYCRRKSVLESEAKYNATVFRNKARFVQSVIGGDLDLLNGRKTATATSQTLAKLKFASKADLLSIRNDSTNKRTPDDTMDDKENTVAEFGYLMNMPMSSLTTDKIIELEQDAKKKEEELQVMEKTSASDLWQQDLKKLAKFL